jgi:hypothetical protein
MKMWNFGEQDVEFISAMAASRRVQRRGQRRNFVPHVL